ncbi:MAG TPA: four helix bundle protein [Candidatus Limnocylindria bacterium]|nr:four helix bundle protein [Candidatus Limnocylindria bacterium]
MAPDLKTRTKKFALEIVRLYSALSKSTEAQVLGRQLLRSGTSVGAHYHEAQRAKSDADFISKIEGGLQELEETGYWLELLMDSGLGPSEKLILLQREANELIGIFVSIATKTKSRSKHPKP